MRISGGEWCGRNLKTPPGDKVRPTQDLVRGALFSIFAAEAPGTFWIDLYGGSGSVGLEALSRGASRVIWIEKDPRNVALIRENCALVGWTDPEVIRADVPRWLAGAKGLRADFAFADPPYVIGREEGFAGLMATAAANEVVRPGGWFIAEMPVAKRAETEVAGWELLKDRTYGHTRLAIYRREEKE